MQRGHAKERSSRDRKSLEKAEEAANFSTRIRMAAYSDLGADVPDTAFHVITGMSCCIVCNMGVSGPLRVTECSSKHTDWACAGCQLSANRFESTPGVGPCCVQCKQKIRPTRENPSCTFPVSNALQALYDAQRINCPCEDNGNS
jgi:hypothetical protein